nr:unnamed protein product [Callosobruchus chinensis]
MAAASACSSDLKGDKCELLIADKEAIEDSDYFARCRYLQKLLSERQDEDKLNKIAGTTPRKGNVYIEEANSKT